MSGIRCERCVQPARRRAHRPRRPRGGEREPHGPGHARLGRRANDPRRAARGDGAGRLSRGRGRLNARRGESTGNASLVDSGTVALMAEAPPDADTHRRRGARPRPLRGGGARALRPGLPRRAAPLRARARRPRISCRRRTRARSAAGARTRPGTNLRAWLLRILTNLNIDRGRRNQRAPQTTPLEANDYYLYDKLAESDGAATDEERVVERLSQDDIVVGALGRAARLPRRDRARRHRRLQLSGRGADPRHPDRDGDVAVASRAAHPEARARGVRYGGHHHDERRRKIPARTAKR